MGVSLDDRHWYTVVLESPLVNLESLSERSVYGAEMRAMFCGDNESLYHLSHHLVAGMTGIRCRDSFG